MFGRPNTDPTTADRWRVPALGLLVTAALIAVAGCGDDGGASSDAPSPVATQPDGAAVAGLELGASVYAQHCSVCHGSGGGGGVGTELVGAALLAEYPDRQALVDAIEDGTGSMVGLGSVLEPTETDAVIDYILTFDGSG